MNNQPTIVSTFTQLKFHSHCGKVITTKFRNKNIFIHKHQETNQHLLIIQPKFGKSEKYIGSDEQLKNLFNECKDNYGCEFTAIDRSELIEDEPSRIDKIFDFFRKIFRRN